MADNNVVDLEGGLTANEVVKQDEVGVGTEQVEVQIPTPETPAPKSIEDLIASQAPASSSADTAETPKAEVAEQPAEEVPPPAPAEEVPPAEESAPAPAEQQADPAEEPKPENPVEEGDSTLSEFMNAPKAKGVGEDQDASVGENADMLYNQVLTGLRANMTKELRKFYKTEEDFEKARKNADSFLNRVFLASIYGWKTAGLGNHYDDVTAALEAKDEKALVRQHEMNIAGLVDGSPKGIKAHGQKVSGAEAAMLIRNKLKGIHRVCLLNSGFWVVLRAPELDELQDIFDSVDADGQEIGRSLGAHFALVSDMFFRKKFTDMLIQRKFIVQSNFADVFKKGAFYRNLSVHDIDTLMHAMLALMTRRGLRYQVVCPECGRISDPLNLDISACKFLNRNMMTPEMIKWWNTTKDEKGNRVVRTEEDLKMYREKILPNQTMIVPQVLDLGDGDKQYVEMKFATPSVSTYYAIGARIIELLNQSINSASSGEEDKANLIKRSYSTHSSQLIAPWVAELAMYEGGTKAEGEKPEIVTDDTNAILDYLDGFTQQLSKTDFLETINDFVAKTRISYYGVCAIECPSCHAVPESKTKSFFPIDLEVLFFGQCWRLLQQGRQ